MSGFPNNNPPVSIHPAQPSNYTTDAPPTQHVHHDSSEPLPGARGARDPVDYSAQKFDRLPSGNWDEQQDSCFPQQSFGTGSAGNNAGLGTQQHRTRSAHGETAFNSDRPMNTRPTQEGGVAVGGRSKLPEGHAGLGDKFVGKTQKACPSNNHIAGILMDEKGELREAGGKAAAQGLARAPHD